MVLGAKHPTPIRQVKGKRNRFQWLALVFIVTIVAAIPIVLTYTARSPAPYAGGGGKGNGLLIGPVPATIHSLKGNSSLVVVAEVVKLNATYYPGICDAYDYQATIIQYLKGAGPQTLYVVTCAPDSPQLQIGATYVFFLDAPASQLFAEFCSNNQCVRPPTPLDLTYPATSGAAGIFAVQNGLVYDMKTVDPQYDWLEITVNAVPENQFISEVQAA